MSKNDINLDDNLYVGHTLLAITGSFTLLRRDGKHEVRVCQFDKEHPQAVRSFESIEGVYEYLRDRFDTKLIDRAFEGGIIPEFDFHGFNEAA